MTIQDMELIRGSKGSSGGKGKGSSSGGSNASDTLRSKARARWVEIISEGPCEGVVGGLDGTGIYFEQTPVKNENGTLNFENVIIDQRLGYPDQAHLTGWPQVETPFDVSTEVKYNTGPVVRTINEENADSVRVIMQLPALVKQDSKTGKLSTTSVRYGIDVRPYGGDWARSVTENLVNQKTTSAVQRAHRVELPLGGCPWDIRVVRETADSDSDQLSNSTIFESYTVVVEGKFIYPNTALVAMEVNAEDMGSSIPARNYRYRGLIVSVPSNYDPINGTYSGGWNGVFKQAWTNNPAWVFWDILTNDRYGLGEFVDPNIIDKWSLYAIAQYCDAQVKTGFKHPITGADLYERRYTFNGVLNSRDDAWKVLQQITATWRGMAFWSLGQVFATADMPQDPVKLFSPANVIGGQFTYSGTSQKARHSVAIVTYNNPDDFYRSDVEIVVDDDALLKYGWRETAVTLTGCTSRSLAHRYGKWILDIEQNETETNDFTAGWDSTDVRPGDIVAIADPGKAQVRLGGRLKAVEATQLWLDGPFVPKTGASYSVYVTLPSGEVKLVRVAQFTNQLFDADGESIGYDRIVLEAPLADLPLVDSMWVLKGTDIQPRLYRIISMKEDSTNQFKITALFHDPNKYARVENMQPLQNTTYTRPSATSLPVQNLHVTEVSYLENGIAKSTLTLSWSNPSDFLTKEYEVGMLSPTSGYNVVGTTSNNAIDISDLATGEYTFYVYAISYSSVRSTPATLVYEVAGWKVSAAPSIADLKLEGSNDGIHFSGRNANISWTNLFPASTSSTATGSIASDVRSPFYQNNTVTVSDTTSGKMLRKQKITQSQYTYTLEMNTADGLAAGIGGPTRNLKFDVTCTDTLQRESNPATLAVSNPVPPAFNPDFYVQVTDIHLSWPAQADDDFAGILVWVETNDTFDPYLTAPRFDGPGGSYVFPGVELQTYYVRVAAYDAFGRVDLNISPPLAIATRAAFDTIPPAIPTGLGATSVAGDKGVSRATVVWNANTEADMAAYDLQIKQGQNGNWVSFPVASGPFEFDATPAVIYQIRIRARDKDGNASEYSDVVTLIAAKDTTPPAVPTNFKVTPGLTSLWLSWTNPADVDLAHIEILESEDNDPLNATVIAYSIGQSFPRTGLPNFVTRYYWLRAADTSGNLSDTTEVEFAKTSALPDANRFSITGLVLTPNDPLTNSVSWGEFEATVGSAVVPPVTATVEAGSAEWTTGSLYLYYVAGDTALRSTTSINELFGNNGYMVAVYRGGADVQTADGKAMMDGNNLIAGTVGANQLVVNDAIITNSLQLKDAVITSAKIIDLDAAQIRAGTTMSDEIIVNGNSLGTISDNAANPAATINRGSTLIQPGFIKVSNTGTLANWAMGGDSTEINGGALATGTVKANSVVVGLRNITLDGLIFDYNQPAINQAKWSAGSVSYINDAGVPTSVAIAAGNSAAWTSGTIYIYWVKDAATLSVTTNVATAFASNCIVLATYRGGSVLNATYGRTVIDGSTIKTGTVLADQIGANVINATHMQANSIATVSLQASAITTDKLAAGAITADKIAAGAIDATTIRAHSITTDLLTIGGVTTDSLSLGACTAAAAAQSGEAQGIGAGGLSQVQAVGINTVGGSYCVIWGSAVISERDINNSSSIPCAIYLYRNGTAIYAAQDWISMTRTVISVSGSSGSNGTGQTTTYQSYAGGILHFVFIDQGPAAGGNTYSFQLLPQNYSLTVSNRLLIATAFKR